MPLLIAATHHHHTHICGGVTDWASVDAEGVISYDIIDCDTFSDDRGPRVVRGQACPRPACAVIASPDLCVEISVFQFVTQAAELGETRHPACPQSLNSR